MSNKMKFSTKIILVLTSIFCIGVLGLITIPPMINLNNLKPKIENAIFNQTGIKSQIHGNVNFSLLGRATIVAHNISIPNGVISSCEFEIPLRDIFNLETANISGDITIKRASLSVNKIVPFDIDNTINVYDSRFSFLNKEYNIVNGTLSKDNISAIVRTDQHKYEIKTEKNKFTIKNQNNNLIISGIINKDGTANGTINIIAQNVNRWFEFDKPRITGKFPIYADFIWNGKYGIDFYNISANGVHGEAILKDDGYKIIKLETKKADYNFDFILDDTELLQNATFELDLYGKIKFMNTTFKHLYINSVGSKNKIEINKIIADDLVIKGGFIDKNGAHNVNISLPENGIQTTCIFNGTPTKWSCEKISYGNELSGNIYVDNNKFTMDISSAVKEYDIKEIVNSARTISDYGIINFNFPNLIGHIKMDGKNIDVKYDYAANKNLTWANIDLPFLPEFMKTENGNIIWDKDLITFVPNSKTWYLTKNKDYFQISGNNFKKWAPHLDLQSMRDLSYIISGNYKRGTISNLTLEIAQHKFVGSASGKNITLKTDIFNIDSFISQSFLDNYEELSFFTVAPITIPFDLDINISLSANTMIYNGQRYNNFVYSLKPKTQTFSISDSNRGNLLAIIKKENLNYDINVQLNKFMLEKYLLPKDMPLNISNISTTAEINLKTNGKIAHDIFDNLHGDFDLSINGGILSGLGFDKFYASAQNLTILNAEFALANALESGETPIKKMRIIGTYSKNNIKTTSPLILSMRHVDAIATIDITNNKMYVESQFILRGTAPGPSPIELVIYPDGNRKYSLYEIMTNFDPEYMRTFVKTHDKF